jgi:hypothetical protein
MGYLCIIDNKLFSRKCDLSRYLKNNYGITPEIYTLKYVLNNNIPKCKCGCGQPVKITKYKINDYVLGHTGSGTWQTKYKNDTTKLEKIKSKISEKLKDKPKTHNISVFTRQKMSLSRKKWIEDNPDIFKISSSKMKKTKIYQSKTGILSTNHFSNTKDKCEVDDIYDKIGKKSSITKKFKFKQGLLKSWNDGLTSNEDSRILSGKNHYRFNPYKIQEYDDIFYDKLFRKFILERQSGRCLSCKGCSGNFILCLHHIDENKKNNNVNNLAFVCRSCHTKIHNNENFKISFNKIFNDLTGG